MDGELEPGLLDQERIDEILANPNMEFVSLTDVSEATRPALVETGRRKRHRKYTSVSFLVENKETGQQVEETFWLIDLKKSPHGMKLLRKFYYGRNRAPGITSTEIRTQESAPANQPSPTFGSVEFDEFEPAAYESDHDAYA